MRIFIAAAAILLLLTTTMIASASPPPTPTATPTLRPIPLSPTSVYLYLRPTPTPLTINSMGIQVTWVVGSNAGQIADTTINVYRAVNHDHLIDFVMFLLMAVVVIGYLVRFAGKTTQDKG